MYYQLSFQHLKKNIRRFIPLRQGSYRFLIDAVKNRELNLAFLGPVPPKDEIIDTMILFSESIHALLPANHPLAKTKKH